MLLTLPDLVETYDLRINGVLHCGAHLAEEADEYNSLNVGDVWWVEANPDVIPAIKSNVAKYPNQHVIQALLYSDNDRELTFHRTNYDGMSSSILDWGTHPQFSPDTVFVDHIPLKTRTIDSLVEECDIRANFLNMDLQGAELAVLKGAQKTLYKIDAIYSEVNKEEVYQGCAKIWELDQYLLGFRRVETYWVPGQGWGDALWLRAR